MNCKEFKQTALADPVRLEAGAEQHLEQCAGCRAWFAETRGFEAVLSDALRLEVPEGLADRILARQQNLIGAAAPRRGGSWYAAYGLAATVLLAFGLFLGVNLDRGLSADQPVALGERMAQHIRMEPRALTVSEVVEPQKVERMFGEVGIRLAGDVGRIQFIEDCTIKEKAGVHLVIRSDRGPVTLFVVPDAEVTERAPVKQGELSGVIVPTPRGAMGILGADEGAVRQVEDAVRRNTEWI